MDILAIIISLPRTTQPSYKDIESLLPKINVDAIIENVLNFNPKYLDKLILTCLILFFVQNKTCLYSTITFLIKYNTNL